MRITFNKNRSVYFILLFFGIIFSSVSLVNHYNFRTYAYDLGIYNNAIYDYAHFRWNDCMLMQPQFKNILSDHFNLLIIFISPLYWIFGSYTLLVVQIAAILFGGYGIFLFFRSRTDKEYIPLLAMIHFFSIWGIYSALSFDYHDNVVGTMFVPWFFYYFDKQDWKKALLFFSLLLISKENMALWAIFIGIGLVLLNLKDRQKQKYAALFSVLAAVYFIVIVKAVIPSFANDSREYLHFKYAALGNNFSEAFVTIIKHPGYVFNLLFENHLKDPDANGIKSELHYMILISGGYTLLYRPQYLIMLIPIYAQKLFNDDYVKWGLNVQYSIEFVPVLTIALFSWLLTIERKKYALYVSVIATALTFYSTISALDHRVSKWYSPEANRFYSGSHYKRDFDVKKMHAALKLIPDNAVVSAQSPLVSHLAFRDFIYQYPDVFNSEYILLSEKESTYPLSQEEYNKKKNEYLNSTEWEIIYNENPLLIFKRKK